MNSDRQPRDGTEGQEALGEALALSFRWLRYALWVLVGVYLLSGLFIVRQQERGFVLLFGRIRGDGEKRVQQPDLHWTLPKPFARIVKVETERVRTVETEPIPRIPQPTGGPVDPMMGTMTPDPAPWDRHLLTGDANLILAQWALRYTVSDPESWLFRQANPETLLRAELERAAVRTTARYGVDAALRTEVDLLRADIEQAMRDRCALLALGVRVERVDLVGLQPPSEVFAAFEAVVQAEQEQSSRISEARAYASRRINEAKGEADRLRSEARADAGRWVAMAEADADYFTQVYGWYKQQPDIVRTTLWQDVVRRALAATDRRFVIRDDTEGRQELRLWLSPARKYLPGEEQTP